jgi:catechol 2,3-dioxygenase-like lactoylglutathione lyase family enzyme
MGLVLALHHVNVTVPPDAESKAKNFYGNVLGLEQLSKPSGTRPSGAWYQIGPNQLHLSVDKDGGGPLSTGHVCFTVSDLSAAEKRLREARVEIIPDPRPIEGTSRFYVRDPGGNMLEIVQAVS